jgi:hypothetical protein
MHRLPSTKHPPPPLSTENREGSAALPRTANRPEARPQLCRAIAAWDLVVPVLGALILSQPRSGGAWRSKPGAGRQINFRLGIPSIPPKG